jgi:hypothetical protein
MTAVLQHRRLCYLSIYGVNVQLTGQGFTTGTVYRQYKFETVCLLFLSAVVIDFDTPLFESSAIVRVTK